MFKSLFEVIKTNCKYTKQTNDMSTLELKKRYSSSTLGVIWALIKPAVFILVYWFGINVGLKGGTGITGDFPYILWLIAGIIPWFFISECLIQGGLSIRTNRHLVTKAVFPIATIPTFVNLSLFKIHLVVVAISTVIFIACGAFSGLYFIQIIYALICLFIFMWAVSTLMSALVVISRDFEYLLKSCNTILFWLSPILWSIDKLKDHHVVQTIIKLNPIAYITSVYRCAFIGDVMGPNGSLGGWFWEHPVQIAVFWGEVMILSFVACFVFKRLENEFADIL